MHIGEVRQNKAAADEKAKHIGSAVFLESNVIPIIRRDWISPIRSSITGEVYLVDIRASFSELFVMFDMVNNVDGVRSLTRMMLQIEGRYFILRCSYTACPGVLHTGLALCCYPHTN